MRLFSSTIAIVASSILLLSGCTHQKTGDTPAQVDGSALETEIQTEASDMEAADMSDMTVALWAGSMEAGFIDGENQTARFIKPYGLTAAPDGGLLIVDSYANLLRVSLDGVVSTLAGSTDVTDVSGIPIGGYLNGSAKEGLMNHPRFAAVSAEGAIVFSDTENHCIRILKDGVLRLMAGSRTAGFKNGRYDIAEFNMPSGVAIGESGVIYVADTLNHCIRQISTDGLVTTLAGTPGQAGYRDGTPAEALFCEPNDIQLGSDGALYVVDKGNQRVRRVVNEEVTTIAGSGSNTDSSTGYIIGGYRDGAFNQAQFLYPTGLSITEDNTIYLADTGNHCIRVITPEGTVSTIAGTKMSGNENGPCSTAKFNQPLDVYYDDGNLYVSDSYNHVIRLVNLYDQKGNDVP